MPRNIVPDELRGSVTLPALDLGLDAEVTLDPGDGIDDDSVAIVRSSVLAGGVGRRGGFGRGLGHDGAVAAAVALPAISSPVSRTSPDQRGPPCATEAATTPIAARPIGLGGDVDAEHLHVRQAVVERAHPRPRTGATRSAMQPWPAPIGQLVPSFQRTIGQL